MIGIAASHRGLKANGRYGSKADVWTSLIDVRFTPKADIGFVAIPAAPWGKTYRR